MKRVHIILVVALLGLLTFIAYNYKLVPKNISENNTNKYPSKQSGENRNTNKDKKSNKYINTNKTTQQVDNRRIPPNERPSSEANFNRNTKDIIYTKHAKCRMSCRHIDVSEVEEILYDGNINWNKSNDRPGPCPTFALEGKTHDNQNVRIVFAQCNPNEVKVVTCIDLDTDWSCDCY